MNTLEEIKTKLEEMSRQAEKDDKHRVSHMLRIAAMKVEQAAKHADREVRRDRQKSQDQTST